MEYNGLGDMHFNCSISRFIERFEHLNNKKEKELNEIISFIDVKKGDLYVNLIYYDKNLKNNEKYEYYRYFTIKIIGDFRPFDDFYMVKLFISKTKEIYHPPCYILLTSEAEVIHILKEFHEVPFITDVIIFCNESDKYLYLKKNYKKIKLISNNFCEIRNFYCLKDFRIEI